MISRPAWLVRQELCLGLPVPCSLINMRKGIPVSGITADASLPTSAAPFLRILHEDGVVPPGLGLKSGRLPSAEQLAEKVVEGARSTPQAQTHFQRLIGTTETRALPKPALIGVFPQVVKRCADTKPDFFRACEAVPFSPLAWPRVLRSEQALLEVRPLPREPPAICALQAVRGASLVRLRGLIRQRV